MSVPGYSPLESTSPTAFGKYAALSHCWGKGKPLLLTGTSLGKLRQAIPTIDLPPLFLDAIMLARRLQIPYLWIDSLCILQDSTEDWEREAAMMSNVYADAWVVFAAHTAKDSLGSLLSAPRVPDTQSVAIQCVGPADTQATVYARHARTGSHNLDSTHGHSRARPGSYYPDTTRDNSSPSPALKNTSYLQTSLLSNRGWVFQERILATRMIHFTRWEAVWECGTEIRCECSSSPRSGRGEGFIKPNFVTQQQPSDGDISDMWRSMVNLFTARDLTFSKDRLPAIAGLAAAMKQLTSATYLQGLWSDDLPRSLLWERNPESRDHSRRCPDVPSRSWASVTGSIWNTYPSTLEFLIEVQKYSESTPNSSHSFKANDMGMMLKGSFADGQFDIRSYDRGGPVFSYRDDSGSRHRILGELRLDVDEGPIELVTGEKCTLLLGVDGGRWQTWLVLKKRRGAEATYRRVGKLRTTDYDPSCNLAQALSRRTVKLV
ncbi:heterokaryon incompatibility protein-domain-containing protein [Stachybotrys elegans]|uniref:Heterokaryon incompatibility protein-domain-containing protein n=1 Tax=Stachybotrys elegans TaxID=80388 RepID=A0A8K0SFR0_9HYPO|nr:heterokaryon incompatibility protein-domain-containing protein [Stachybotrys elegans]